jgi:hypothetical protein
MIFDHKESNSERESLSLSLSPPNAIFLVVSTEWEAAGMKWGSRHGREREREKERARARVRDREIERLSRRGQEREREEMCQGVAQASALCVAEEAAPDARWSGE